jgi:hypothetical protein
MEDNRNYLKITEVLFSLFGVLDPRTLGQFSAVCKQWDQMSKDQELWRQFCIKKWKIIPKDSDCAKNWLIPSEGKDKKRIDWRRVYIIRDLSDQIVDHLKEVQFITTPPNRRSAFFLNKKKIIDFFAKGWIDAKQIPVWGDQLKKILFKLVLHDENNEFPTEKLYRMLLTILDFHLELELVMAKQAKVSNIKHLGFASYFLREAKFIFRGISAHSLFQLSKRLLRSAQLYVEVAKVNEIPVPNVGEYLHGCAGIFSIMDAKHPHFNESIPDLAEFIKLVLHCIDSWSVENEFKEWIGEELDAKQEHFPSPTYDFDQSLFELSTRIQLILSKDFTFLDTLLRDFKTSNPMTTMALICFMAPSCKGLFLEHMNEFMEKYFKPYFKVSSEPKDLIPMFYYFQNVISQIPDDLCSKYPDALFSVLIAAARVNHVKVHGYVCSTVFNLCRMISDERVLCPYMESLLDALYPLLHSPHSDVREGAVSAITSALIRTKHEFHKYQVRTMEEFLALCKRSASDQQAVFEELGRLTAALGDQSGGLGQIIEQRFDEIIEAFKRDRPTNEQALLNMTGSTAISLGKNFSKYLTTVMPFVLELATPNVPHGEEDEEVEELDDEDDDDMDVVEEIVANDTNTKDDNVDTKVNEDDDNDEDIKEEIEEDEKQLALREKALEVIGFLLELPREDMLPYFQEIGTSLSANFETQHDLDILLQCINDYSDYTRLFFTKDADEQFLTGIRPFAENVTNLFALVLLNIEDYDRKTTINIETRLVEQYTDILNILKNASNTPLFDPPFVSQTMEFFMAVYIYLTGRADDDWKANEELADQIVMLFEVILRNAIDKKAVLEDLADFFTELETTLNQPCEARWTEFCLLAEMIEVIGELPAQDNLIPHLSQCLWECRKIDSETLQQCVACSFGIIFKKFSTILGATKDLTDWLLTLLSDEYRTKRPQVYDNALLTLGLITGKSDDLSSILTFTKKFPPAHNGDAAEIPKIVTILLDLGDRLKEKILGDPELRTEIIRALTATLALENYNNVLPVVKMNQLIASLQ